MSEKENQSELEERVKVAKLNLDKAVQLKDLAVSGLMTYEQYGKLNSGLYEEAVSNVPDEQTYKTLYLPALLSKEGAVHQEYLKERSQRILIESLSVLSAEDALKYAGFKKEIDEKYKGKYVHELNEEEAGKIIGTYLSNLVEETIVKKIMPLRAKQRTKGLEEIFAKKEEKAA
jgi:hypothetical protein